MYYYYTQTILDYDQAKDFCNEPGFHFPVFMTTEQYDVVHDIHLEKISE